MRRGRGRGRVRGGDRIRESARIGEQANDTKNDDKSCNRKQRGARGYVQHCPAALLQPAEEKARN